MLSATNSLSREKLNGQILIASSKILTMTCLLFAFCFLLLIALSWRLRDKCWRFACTLYSKCPQIVWSDSGSHQFSNQFCGYITQYHRHGYAQMLILIVYNVISNGVNVLQIMAADDVGVALSLLFFYFLLAACVHFHHEFQCWTLPSGIFW